MGSRSRRKGAQWERDLAEEFAARLGLQAKRGLGQARGGGAEVPDVVVPLFHVEAKVGKRPNILAALAQAEADSRQGVFPIAVCKLDRKGSTVTMRLEDWCELVRLWLTETGDVAKAEALVAAIKTKAGV